MKNVKSVKKCIFGSNIVLFKEIYLKKCKGKEGEEDICSSSASPE